MNTTEKIDELMQTLAMMKAERKSLASEREMLRERIKAIDSRLGFLDCGWIGEGGICCVEYRLKKLKAVEADEAKTHVHFVGVPLCTIGETSSQWIVDRITPLWIYIRTIGGWEEERFRHDGTHRDYPAKIDIAKTFPSGVKEDANGREKQKERKRLARIHCGQKTKEAN